MTLMKSLTDMIGHTLVHADEARRTVCFWNGSVVFLEYHVSPNGGLEHGDAWSTSKRPSAPAEALAIARSHYGLTHG